MDKYEAAVVGRRFVKFIPPLNMKSCAKRECVPYACCCGGAAKTLHEYSWMVGLGVFYGYREGKPLYYLGSTDFASQYLET